jgi:hypothetical protein
MINQQECESEEKQIDQQESEEICAELLDVLSTWLSLDTMRVEDILSTSQYSKLITESFLFSIRTVAYSYAASTLNKMVIIS